MRKTTEEMIAVMQAYSEGKTIEAMLLCQAHWNEVLHPTWDWCNTDYRIKPEPKTMYVLLRYGDDKERWGSTFNKSEAELWAEHYDGHDGIIRKFVEVVED